MSRNTLTDTKIKLLKPKNKPYKVSDGTIGGLHVAVSVAGGKVFYLAYRFEDKRRLLHLGAWPMFGLEEARDLARDAKKQLAQGIDPAAAKKVEKAQVRAEKTTFRIVAAQWLAWRQSALGVVTVDDTVKRLEKHVLPRFGDKPIADVTKADIKAVLDTLQAQAKYQTLKKVRGTISQVLRYAIEQEIPGVEVDWAAQVHRQYARVALREKHRATITDPRDVRRLIKAIESYEDTSRLTYLALKFSALTFARPGEIRHGEWTEIDWDAKLWRIPADKMKMRKPHLVPLAKQAIAVLEQLKPVSGHSKYLFPSVRTAERPMSEITVLAALRRMGYEKHEMCAHGFRGMASTILNEKGVNRDWIEMQLAHSPRDTVRSAYNHAEFLDDRRNMMQGWADFLYDQEDKSN
jgi:integrase